MTAYPGTSASPTSRSISEKGVKKAKRIPERLLAKFWKERAVRQKELRTEAGKRVRVVYPGRSGVTAGPDFRDALLEVEGVGLVRGDVELHIKQSDWNSHGHGRDPNYNGVVFHGALEVSSPETRLQSGSLAPVVDLRSLLTEAPEDGPLLDLWQVLSRRGFPRPATLEEAERTLERAGDQRFYSKARWLSTCIRSDGPDQALYQSLMEGLGYSSNRSPFVQLASSAPFYAVTEAAKELPPGDRVTAIGEWLTACSGLDRPSRAIPLGLSPAMDRREWHLFRVRPTNHPRRRILGAAMLLGRFLDVGLAAGLREVVHRSSPAKLTQALCAQGGDGPAYVGRARAIDLAVNAVLPFMHAWEQAEPCDDAPGVPESLYARYPLLSDNEITREMAAQLLPAGWRGAASNARRQQGLLHLSDLLKGAF